MNTNKTQMMSLSAKIPMFIIIGLLISIETTNIEVLNSSLKQLIAITILLLIMNIFILIIQYTDKNNSVLDTKLVIPVSIFYILLKSANFEYFDKYSIYVSIVSILAMIISLIIVINKVIKQYSN